MFTLKFKPRVVGFALCAMICAVSNNLAHAQVQITGHSLPLALANEAAQEAIHACELKGYRVSAAIVDVSGLERVVLRGDHSTVHTRETAFKKAYTIVTLGPIFDAATTSSLVERVNKTPTGPALSSVSNILILAGGVVLKSHDEVIGAIGVGGAPGGALDESCAQAGVDKIRERLNAL